MAYNPKADPYYADLFDPNPTSFAEDYQTSLGKFRQQESQQLQNELSQAKLEEAVQEKERNDRIKDSLQGVSYDDPDIYEKAQKAYAMEGQIDKVIELQKTRDSMQAQKEARDQRELSIINGIKDPETQARIWNDSKLASIYGQRDPATFQDQKLQIGADGRVIDMNSLKPGDTVPGFKAPKGEGKPSPKAVYDEELKKNVYIDSRDPYAIQGLYNGRYSPPKSASGSESSFLDAPVTGTKESPTSISNADRDALMKIKQLKSQFGGNINVQSMIKRPTVK